MKRLVVMFVLFTSGLFAQKGFENYKKGYIINKESIKVECFIENFDWDKAPKYFNYKISETSKKVKATVENCKEVKINEGFKYIVANVDIDTSTEITSALDDDENIIFKNKTLFLKVLMEGNLSNLYHYKTKASDNRFFL